MNTTIRQPHPGQEPEVVINRPANPRDEEHLLLFPFIDDDPKCNIFIG